MSSKISTHILELESDAVRFEPVSKLTNVFYDEANCQVFAVRSGGTTGVVVKGPLDKTIYSFRMLDKGDVMSIKFSPDKKILSVQRSFKSIEFINFDGEPEKLEYSQSCKGKNMKILGFSWTHTNEIVFVMDKGIEHYQVIPEKHTLKSLKVYNASVNWYVFHPNNSLLLLSSGSSNNVMHPFQFRPGAAYKLSKFEIDLPVALKTQKICLLERDVNIATLYGKTCVFVLRHQPRSVGSPAAEIVIYKVIKDGPPRKTDILRLDRSGRFAINVINNIIVVHHQASKESSLYDIQMPSTSDGYVSYHTPIVKCSIKPFLIKIPELPGQSVAAESEVSCELYSPNWVVFLPNIIIDPKLGYLWNVVVSNEPLMDVIHDKPILIDFLLLRSNSKSIILKVCHDAIVPQESLPLASIAKIFDKLNLVYKQISDSHKANTPPTTLCTAMVDQSDMYTHVFSMFEEEYADSKFSIAVLLEYIRSLIQHQQTVQHFICKLLINILVRTRQFYQLHQFLQYQIVNDSKQLVYLLLSLQGVYPSAYHLALDMMRRLQKANEELDSCAPILEVFLSQQKILQALSFVRSCNMVDGLSAQKYLSAAKHTRDDKIFYATYKFFEQRNMRLRGSPDFEAGEHCDTFVKYFNNAFGSVTSEDGVSD